MTRRKRRRPPWPVQLVGTVGALVVAGLAVDGIGRLLLAAVRALGAL